MKAKEYIDKYYDRLISEDHSVALEATKELAEEFFLDEPRAMMKARNVKSDRGAIPVFKELNQKWIAMCKQLEQKYGGSVLKKDAFKDFWVERIPDLSGKL